MLVSEINSAKAVSLQSDMPAVKAYRKIENIDHTKFPVVDSDNKLVGIVDKSDLEDLASSGSAFQELRFSSFLSRTKVRDVMNNNVYCCRETDTIWEAALNMKDHRVSILPVVNEDNILLSVLARKDLFKALLDYTGAKYTGMFLAVSSNDNADIFKVTEIISRSDATLRFIAKLGGRIALKISGTTLQNAVENLEAEGFKVLYTAKIY